MTEWPRRDLLQALGVSGAALFAGCQASEREDTPSTANPPETDGTEATAASATETETRTPRPAEVTFDVAATAGDTPGAISVAGTVESTRPLTDLTVAVRETNRAVALDGGEPHEFSMTLRVAGGTEYDVEVSAVTESGERVVDAITSEYIPIDVDPADPQRLVGAHYYPWYEMADGHRNWTDRVVSRPALGEYASDSERIVDRHVAWSLAHGIRWWSISWWGAGSGTDVALRETVLEADRVDELEFSILYETVGRFGEFDLDMDRPGARRRLAADLTYLENEYFHRDNYLHIDGRPVVYFYVAGGLEGDVAGAFDAAAADLDVDPYVLADVPFGRPPTGPVMAVADGLSPYNPYDAREDIETVFHDRYEAGNKMLDLGARAADVDMIPVVIPGYDDTGLPARIREDNPVLSASPERFERVCDQVNPHLADAPAVLVTSFNEWYEDTQIEPDETHGEAYLDTVAAKLASADSRGFDPTGAMLELEFDRAIQPDGSSRHLSFMATRIAFAADGRSLVSYDIGGSPEPLYVGGVYYPESHDGETWRWFGGEDAQASLFVDADVEGADTMTIYGRPMRSNEIEATVTFAGEELGTVGLGKRDGSPNRFRFSL